MHHFIEGIYRPIEFTDIYHYVFQDHDVHAFLFKMIAIYSKLIL